MALLDTVIVIRLLRKDKPVVRSLGTQSLRRPLWFSPISIFEIGNKVKVGRLDIPESLPEIAPILKSYGLNQLDLRMDHILRAQDFGHPNPYDRLLLAQADVAGMPLLTTDTALLAFPNVLEL